MTRSRSARVASERPFYGLHADAYDALISDPVEPWVRAVTQVMHQEGLCAPRVLDAGCGTGRHAAALIEAGCAVTLLDASATLLDVAVSRSPGAPAILGDLCSTVRVRTFDAIVCRGVLNDLIEDEERDRAMSSFAQATVPGGILALDVRDLEASRARADGGCRDTEVLLPNGHRLRYRSRPTWQAGLLRVEEQYELADGNGTEQDPRAYVFTMRPWTPDELRTRLQRAGYDQVSIQPGVGRRTPDRLFVTARRTSDQGVTATGERLMLA